MSQSVTLTLPDRLFAPIERTARATQQPIESLLLTTLLASLPPLEGLSADLMQELTQLELLDNDALRKVMLETMPTEKHRALEALLYRNQAGTLSAAEHAELDELQREADRLMLRKARAAVLLRFRGLRVPALAELRQLTMPTS